MQTKKLTQQLGKIITELEAIRKELSVGETEEATFPESRRHLIDAEICLACGEPLGNEKPTRKCHYRCYKRLGAEVKAGSTWDELIAEGRCYFAGSGGRPAGRKSSDQQAKSKEAPAKRSAKNKSETK